MASEDLKALRGVEMDDQNIEEFLYEQGHGILSLANDDEAYGVPISFGFDGEKIFLHLIRFGDQSKKMDLLEENSRVSLTTYDVETRFRWRSVIVTGSLSELPEDQLEYSHEIMEDNAWFPSIFPPTEPITKVHRYVLEIEQATGRVGEEYQD